MAARIAINGLGRIGRAALKIILNSSRFEVAAVNDLIATDNLAYLLRYDSVYGRWSKRVTAHADRLHIEDAEIPVLHHGLPAELPWAAMKVDLVFECTGRFTKEDELLMHLKAGAKHVVLSAPAKSETDR
jgi:glyceraldehyde 3-phosphate dehydrogenase